MQSDYESPKTCLSEIGQKLQEDITGEFKRKTITELETFQKYISDKKLELLSPEDYEIFDQIGMAVESALIVLTNFSSENNAQGNFDNSQTFNNLFIL